MPSEIFVYYEGDFRWFASMVIVKEAKIQYSSLILEFLAQLNKRFGTSIEISSIEVSIMGDSDLKPSVPIVKLDVYLPDSIPDVFDILVSSPHSAEVKRPPAQFQKVQKFLEVGRALEAENQFTSSLLFYQAADIYGIFDIAKLYYRLKKWKHLEQIFPRLLTVYPSNLTAAQIYGATLEHLGQEDKALSFYQNTLKEFQDVSISIAISRIYLQKGDCEMAINAISKYLSCPTNEIAEQAALVYSRSKSFDLAIRTALIHPSSILAEICHDKAAADIAFSYFASLKLSPAAICGLSEIFLKKGQIYEALRLLRFIDSTSTHFLSLKILLSIHDSEHFQEVQHTFAQQTQKSLKNSMRLYLLSFISYVDRPKFEKRRSYQKHLIDHSIVQIPKEFFNETLRQVISILYLSTIEMFLSGYVEEANALRERLSCYNEIMAENPKIREFLPAFIHFPPSDQSFFIYGSVGSFKPIYVIGDEHTIYAGLMKIAAREDTYEMRPMPVPGLSLWKLREEANNEKKAEFLEVMKRIVGADYVVLVLGNNDCEREIPKLLRKQKFPNAHAAVEAISKLHKDVLQMIQKVNPNGTVIVHPAIHFGVAAVPIVQRFNREIESGESGNWKILSQVDTHAEYLSGADKGSGHRMAREYYSLLSKSLLSCMARTEANKCT